MQSSGLFLDTRSGSADNQEKKSLSSKTSGCSTIKLLGTHWKLGFKCEIDLLMIVWIVLYFLNTVWSGCLINHVIFKFGQLLSWLRWDRSLRKCAMLSLAILFLSNCLIHEYEKSVGVNWKVPRIPALALNGLSVVPWTYITLFSWSLKAYVEIDHC